MDTHNHQTRSPHPLDLRCYFVTGSPPAGSSDHAATVQAARAAALAGAGVIQVRSKPISARDLYQLAAAICEAVADSTAAVLIDDRVDVALALREQGYGVKGVHVGQDDLDVRAVRSLLGPDAIIGLTTGTRELVLAANEYADVIDYIGCGPYRATPTKDSGRPPLGVAGYEELVPLSAVPVVAIGDITPADVPALVNTGVAGVAMVRAIQHAADPGAVCREVLTAFEGER